MSLFRKVGIIFKLITIPITIILIVVNIYFKVGFIGKVLPDLNVYKQWYLCFVLCIGEVVLIILCKLARKSEKRHQLEKKRFTVHVD